MRTTWWIVAIVAACGTKKDSQQSEPVAAPIKTEHKAEVVAKPAAPAPAPVPTPPPAPPQSFAIDRLKAAPDDALVEALIQDVRSVATATAPELVPMRITSSYIRKDGSLDPSYGKLELELALLDGTDGVVDDPKRPTGAPVPDAKPAEKTRDRCPRLTYTKGAWSTYDFSCHKAKVKGSACSVVQIWAKAIAQGAPDNAVAVVGFDGRTSSWRFQISDKLRNVSFIRTYRDDCGAPGEPARPAAGSGSGLVKSNPYAPRGDDDLKNPFANQR